MPRIVLIASTLACLVASTAAAAFDETRDDFVAPGLHVGFSFGGSKPLALNTPPAWKDETLALDDTASADSGSKTAWIVVGVVAVAVIVVVASHGGGGGGGGGGGY